MKTIKLDISGMTCEHCARTVENAIRTVPGAERAEINYDARTGKVEVRNEVSDGDVLAAVERVGYKARTVSSERSAATSKPGAGRGGGDGFDLLVIGTGAAGMAAAIRGAELGRRVAIVEAGTIGGTCVNVGCIPSKNLIAAAERYHESMEGFPGVEPCHPSVRWREIQAQKGALVESLRQSKYMDVLTSYPEVALLRGRARIRANGVVEVNGTPNRAAKIVVAVGTEPWIPPIDGADTVEVLNSTTVMELEGYIPG